MGGGAAGVGTGTRTGTWGSPGGALGGAGGHAGDGSGRVGEAGDTGFVLRSQIADPGALFF